MDRYRTPADRTTGRLQVVPLLLGLIAVAVILALVGSVVHGMFSDFLSTLEGVTAP